MRISDWSSDVCSSDLKSKLCGHWRSPRMAGVRLRLTVDCMDPRHPDVVVSVNTCVQIKVLIHVGSERTIVGMYGKCDASEACSTGRSEESRVGKECVSTCSSRGSARTNKKQILSPTLN